jgi:hypothetical protein
MQGERGASLLGLIVAVVFVVGAVRLGTGTLTEPGPGFFPLLGGVALGLLSAALLVRARGDVTAFGVTRRQAALLAGMVGYAATLDLLGDLVATSALAALSLRACGLRSWPAIGAGSAGLALAAHLLFVRVLGMDLPAGLLARLG